MSFPFYPTRPMNGGRFDLTSDKGPEWAYEPKMNGWRILVHPRLHEFWNRHGGPSSIAPVLEPFIPMLPSDAGWLDSEVLERRGTGKGILLVLDAPEVPGDYETRRKAFAHLPVVPLRKDGHIKPGVYRLPSMTEKEARKFWKKWEGSKLIEGVVAKRRDAEYVFQSTANQDTHKWVKHRWD